MKKRLLYVVVLVLISIANNAFVYGQSGSTTLNKLQGKTWRYQWTPGTEESYDSELKFSCCALTSTAFFYSILGEEEEIIAHSRLFYLSDTYESLFDDNKVGKNQNGKYLVVKGDGSPEDDDEYNTESIFVYEILKLTDTEFIIKHLITGTVSNYKALEVCTMKYVMDNTPTEKTPFSVKGKTFLDGYNFPINNKTIPDRLYKNVQLTQYTNNTTGARGKFLRKCLLTNGNYIVIVSFGDVYNDRTDVLCLVDKNGNILSTLEGMVIVNSVKVKEYSITGADGIVYISQVVPSTSTPSLSFEGFPNFSGNAVIYTYYVTGGQFVKNSTNTGQEKTFTKSRMSDPDLNVPQY